MTARPDRESRQRRLSLEPRNANLGAQMLLATKHGTLLGIRENGEWIHQRAPVDAPARPVEVEPAELREIDNSQWRYRSQQPDLRNVEFAFQTHGVALKRDGRFLSAHSDQPLLQDNDVCGDAETFWPVDREFDPETEKSFGDHEANRFRRRVHDLISAGSPVKLHLACGIFPRKTFTNIDISIASPRFFVSDRDSYFIFPFADGPLGLPENSVDYVFHEDFIEHIDQTNQVQILAETLKVLKPGQWHRLSTPNFLGAMKRRSDFSLGFSGIYTGERQWDHIAMLTPTAIKELAKMVGYSHVVFNRKNNPVSKFAADDRRPFQDRDERTGHIFADLLKDGSTRQLLQAAFRPHFRRVLRICGRLYSRRRGATGAPASSPARRAQSALE